MNMNGTSAHAHLYDLVRRVLSWATTIKKISGWNVKFLSIKYVDNITVSRLIKSLLLATPTSAQRFLLLHMIAVNTDKIFVAPHPPSTSASHNTHEYVHAFLIFRRKVLPNTAPGAHMVEWLVGWLSMSALRCRCLCPPNPEL